MLADLIKCMVLHARGPNFQCARDFLNDDQFVSLSGAFL